MKFLIVGRSGRGKDRLAELLKNKYHWKFVCSYTTRQKRTPDENTHIFITPEEAASIPEEDKVAITYLKNGNGTIDEYFATKQQVEECDAYIIDPKGIDYLLNTMPDTVFEIAYIQTKDLNKTEEMIVQRANGNVKEIDKWKERCDNEDEQFTAFEQSITDQTFGTDNCRTVMPLENDYREETLEDMAFQLNARKNLYKNMQNIISSLAAAGNIYTNETNKIRVVEQTNNPDNPMAEKYYTPDRFIVAVLQQPDLFQSCVQSYLSLPTVTVQDITKVKRPGDLSFREYAASCLEDKLTNMENKDRILDSLTDHLLNEKTFVEILDKTISDLFETEQETE